MERNNSSYEKDFIPYVVHWGMVTNLAAFLLSMLPACVLFFYFGLIPSVSQMLAAIGSILSVMVFLWVIEPIAYFPILGIPGTFMAFLSGNISNLKLPCSAVAQEAAGVENGTDKGAIISTFAIVASTVVCLLFLTVGAVVGTGLLTSLPPSITKSLTYLLPGLFGGLFAKFAFSQLKLGAFALALAGVMYYLLVSRHLAFLPGRPTWAVILVAVFGTILVARLMNRDKLNAK
jgi:hypothetical protein